MVITTGPFTAEICPKTTNLMIRYHLIAGLEVLRANHPFVGVDVVAAVVLEEASVDRRVDGRACTRGCDGVRCRTRRRSHGNRPIREAEVSECGKAEDVGDHGVVR